MLYNVHVTLSDFKKEDLRPRVLQQVSDPCNVFKKSPDRLSAKNQHFIDKTPLPTSYSKMNAMTYFFLGDLEGKTNRLAHNIMGMLINSIML